MLSSQPTPLEIAVTLQGATPVAGSDRRELFTETTKTTLVFENGAVVSLKAKVAPGQCLFLRNEQSGREILCKVLETRPGGTGRYTDLEFTSRNPGFWDPPAAKPAAVAQNDSQPSGIPAPAETQVVALKLEPVGAPVETGTAANPPETSAPATTETKPPTSATATTAPVSAPDTEADWNEAKDAQLAAALELMAGDAKPKTKSKPQRKSAVACAEANGTDDADPQLETTLEAAGDAKVSSILPSLTGRDPRLRSGQEQNYGGNCRIPCTSGDARDRVAREAQVCAPCERSPGRAFRSIRRARANNRLPDIPNADADIGLQHFRSSNADPNID